MNEITNLTKEQVTQPITITQTKPVGRSRTLKK